MPSHNVSADASTHLLDPATASINFLIVELALKTVDRPEGIRFPGYNQIRVTAAKTYYVFLTPYSRESCTSYLQSAKERAFSREKI
jgi:hypothetical protein